VHSGAWCEKFVAISAPSLTEIQSRTFALSCTMHTDTQTNFSLYNVVVGDKIV